MQHEDSAGASDSRPGPTPPVGNPPVRDAATLLSRAWESEGFSVRRPDAPAESPRGMALWYAVTNAAAFDESRVLAAIKAACMIGLLFPAIAFLLALIITAATTNAPNPTDIFWAAVLGVILGAVGSYVARMGYRSYGTYLCSPASIDESMQSALANHGQAGRYAEAIRSPGNRAGVMRGDLIHIAHLLRA